MKNDASPLTSFLQGNQHLICFNSGGAICQSDMDIHKYENISLPVATEDDSFISKANLLMTTSH